MAFVSIYNPFRDFRFADDACFLTGHPLSSRGERITVFPTWLMQRFGLKDKPFRLLDESIRTYGQLTLPCASSVAERIAALDREVEAAFSAGYTRVREMDPLTLFQWVGRTVYGVVFNEIQAGMRQQQLSGEPMNFSQVLRHKFTNLHLMLQSLIVPMQFDGAIPFTVVVQPVDNPEGTFRYRDEINTLVYSLRINDFGLIVCLQDNGANGIYHADTLKLSDGQPLHPIQFEELCARFFYSAYLFNRLPEYTVLPTDEAVYVEPMPLTGMQLKPIFDQWQVRTYGQVLENFWKPWGYTLFEIIQDPENPMTFLTDGRGTFRPGSSIPLDRGPAV